MYFVLHSERYLVNGIDSHQHIGVNQWKLGMKILTLDRVPRQELPSGHIAHEHNF
jgi:hypothetical protein